MTTPPLICRRCGSFGPTMADLANLCEGHAPVVDRMPAVVQALDASGQVLASFVPPPGAVRLVYEGAAGAAPGGTLPMPSVGFLPGPDATTKDEHGIDRAAFASFSAEGYRCSRCHAAGKTLDGMVAACTCEPALLAPPTEAIPGRPFAPFMTTPPAPEGETVGFSVKMPDKPAPWGPLKIQFQAVDAAGNVLASVPAGEELDPPPGAVGFRYLIDRVEGGDELVVSPSVGFRPEPDIVAEPEALSRQRQFLETAPASSPPRRFFGYSGRPMDDDDGAPPPSPEHEAAGAVLVLIVNPGHEGRLLFCAPDGELLEAAADGVPHAVPVGTDHVRLSVRRKA